MLSVGDQPNMEFELASGIHRLLPHLQVEGVPVLSSGALLEWLLAIQQSTDHAMRLVGVRCFSQGSFGPAVRARYREEGGRVVVLLGTDPIHRLALSASLDDATPTKGLEHAPAEASGSDPTVEQLDGAAFYTELARLGVESESDVAVVREVRWGALACTARLEPEPIPADDQFLVGPRAWDAALQLGMLCARRKLGAAVDPWASIDRVVVFQTHGTPVQLLARGCTRVADGACAKFDVHLLDQAGVELARLEGLTFGDPVWSGAAARTRVAAVIRDIVRMCLGDVELDDNTDFTALGASSLDLVRIGSAVRERLDWSPTLGEFLANPTVTGLTELYLQLAPAASPFASSATAGSSGSEVLSPIEAQLWFLERLTNVAPSYNEGCAWRLRGPLEIDTLERALQLLQRRHAALRSYFPERAGAPERALAWRQCSLELIATEHGSGDSPGRMRALIEECVRRPFDLEREAPFRCTLFLHDSCDAVLVLTAHHIICDAWSLARVLVSQLGAAYAALLEGRACEVRGSAPPRSSSDFARQLAAERHFCARLAEVPHVLDFPFDHPRPPQQTHRGACLRGPVGRERWAGLKALARRLQVSPFVVTLAIYQVLLHRYTRQPAFCLGVPVSLRRSSLDDDVVGCLLNVSVVCARIDPERTFAELCQQVKADVIEVLGFAQLSLGDIVRAVAPVRSLSHSPLVQSVFGYRELPAQGLDLLGLEVEPLCVHNRAAKFDLAFAIDDHAASAELILEYASDLLEARSAERLMTHFEGLLDDVVERPNAALAELRLAGDAERQRIAAWELGPRSRLPELSFGLGLLTRADASIALRVGDESWSVGRLKHEVHGIAARLRAAGVRPGDFVALCLPRGPEWVASALAVLELGAAYAPFDRINPRERIRLGISRSGARVVIASGAADTPDLEAGHCLIDLAQPSPESASPGASRTGPEDFARPVYAIMTSGSTGLPRVAAVALAGFTNLVSWYIQALGLGAHDRVLVASSVGFDLTQKNVFAALVVGAELILDPGDVPDPARLCETIEARGVTVMNCTPSLAYRLVAAAAARGMQALRSLRVLVLGGEPIDWNALRAWTEQPSCRARIMNSYGPTECSDVVTACFVEPGQSAVISIGLPIAHARCRVVDAGGGVAALGVPGELWLSGTPLGLGYLGDREATQTRFVHDEAGTRWYRTGDLVRRQHDGALEFLGRIDNQVKIRGYRVELAEVEAALKEQPGVDDAVVVCSQDGPGRSSLVGYVCTRAPEAACRPEFAAQLRRQLARRLPSYMIPSTLLPLECIPRTPSGKLDRRALPAVRLEAELDEAPVEEGFAGQVARIWCAALGAHALGSEANFFEHGGHSLAAIEVISALERALGCPLAVASLFERPTLAEFVPWLREQLPTRREANCAFSDISRQRSIPA